MEECRKRTMEQCSGTVQWKRAIESITTMEEYRGRVSHHWKSAVETMKLTLRLPRFFMRIQIGLHTFL